MSDSETKKLIKQAISAVEAEIEAVREKPSQDVFFDGQRSEHSPPEEFYYEFKTQNRSIRFADVVRGEMDGVDEELELYVVETKEEKITLHFPHNYGETIQSVHLEWENDFILRKLRSELEYLYDTERKTYRKRIGRLFDPDRERDGSPDKTARVLDDNKRNEAQHEALVKSLQNRVLFVWGPPGTGKTSTLGFVIANYLVKGKRVLFASNTNRAVDVGLLSTMKALTAIEKEHLERSVTRFGEIALESPPLEQVHFEQQLEQHREQQKQKASTLDNTLSRFKKLQDEIDNLVDLGETVPDELKEAIEELEDQLNEHGGEMAVEDKIEELTRVNERKELMGFQLTATTLAKVCTSDLFDGLSYDAVVIDEASMANLPYLMVMAAKAKKHIIVVGDPMQLPPIAVTAHHASRRFLEKDIFTYASNSKTTEDLFSWHDFNSPITTFFDTQYRMKQDLAEVLSSVFYEGRLKTTNNKLQAPKNGSGVSTVNVIDTQKYGPVLTQKDDKRGFNPVNEVHLQVVVRMIKRLVINNNVLPDEIGIMVPFRNSVYDIKDRLYGQGFDQIEVGTIHTFQGREKKVIIFDTVMSGERQYDGTRHYSVRPFDEEKNGLSVPRLLNVAFSRSKERLVILADMKHINRMYREKYLGRLLQRFSTAGARTQ